MHRGGPTAKSDDTSQVNPDGLDPKQRLALAEAMLVRVVDVVHGLREEIEGGSSGPQDNGDG